MFDGNHRSRRQVNLGGRSRNVKSRPAADDKTSLLARTAALRRERQMAAQRDGAARTIQRVWRGHAVRRTVQGTCREQLLQKQPWLLSLERQAVLLNYYLGRAAGCLRQDTAKTTATTTTTTVDEIRTLLQRFAARLTEQQPQPLLPLPAHVWIHRITQTCLRLLLVSSSSSQQPPRDDAYLLALWHACTALVPVSSPRCLGQHGDGLVLLAQTALATNHDALYDALQQTTRTTCPALLAAVGWSTGRCTDDVSLAAVVQVMTTNTAADPLSAAARSLARTDVILRYALPRPTVLPVVLQLWRDDPAVLAHTQWRVLGRTAAAEGRTSPAAEPDEEDEEEDDDDMDVEPAASRTTTTRRKPQISTLSKLDRLARDTMNKWRQSVQQPRQRPPRDDHTAALAATLSDPALWVTWGRTCLSSTATTMATTSTAASLYVTALLQILPTGLYARHTATSPVLTKLAFDAGILQALFRYAETQPSCLTTLTVLSNVFAQTLMVIKDDEFMATYTGPHAIISAARVIQLIRQALYHVYWVTPVQVDDISTGFAGATPNPAVHFILAGTKLYNALYQRWCRTVRHPDSFASEDIWRFPNLSSSLRVKVGVPIQDEEDDDSSVDSDAMDISPADVESEALAAAFDDPKLSRVLTSIPQALPFEKRVKLFDSLVKADKTKTQDESRDMQHAIAAMMRGQEFENGGRQRVEIRREHLYQDAMHQLNTLGPKLRQRVQVSFINQHGAAEAGIDGGGVFKEFLDDLVKDAFSLEQSATSTLPLFTVTSLETLAINLDYANRPDLLSHYEFLGRAIGKAVYEGILVDPQFCLPFLNQLLGKANSLEDLKNLDPTYYKNLTKLLSLKSSDFASLGLTFEVSIGSTGRTVELKPGGSQLAVTPENVIPYAHLVAHQLLNVQSAAQTRAFLRGFRDLVPAPWVRLFAAHELQKIISGDDRGLDVPSFKATMQYAAGYHPSQSIIQWFWEIVEKDLTQDQQCKLLKFMTSCSRQPLLGFNSLEPAPCIQQIRLPETLFLQDPVDILKRAPLPTSSTCMNLLKVRWPSISFPRVCCTSAHWTVSHSFFFIFNTAAELPVERTNAYQVDCCD